MSYYLTKSQEDLGQRAHAFADEFLEPIAAELDRGLVFPKSLIDHLAAQGFLGLTVPGQADSGFVGHIEVVQALSRSCAAIASIVNNHALVAYAIAKWGSDAQKEQYLPALIKGQKLGAVAIQETGPTLGFGPDAVLATRQDGGFVLNGIKTFVRNAGAADVYLVFGSIRPDADNTRLTCFIVDAGASGLTVGPRLDTMGLKACPVAQVSFKDAAIKEAAVMGSENNASGIADQILSVLAVAEGAQTVGIARAAVEHAAEYSKQRVQFRHPIAKLQAIQTMLAEIVTDSHMAWLGVQHAARLIEDDAPFEPEAGMVKMFLGRVGSKMLADAIQVEGGMGICEVVPKQIPGSLPLARMFRDIAGTTLLDAPNDFPDKLIASDIA